MGGGAPRAPRPSAFRDLAARHARPRLHRPAWLAQARRVPTDRAPEPARCDLPPRHLAGRGAGRSSVGARRSRGHAAERSGGAGRRCRGRIGDPPTVGSAGGSAPRHLSRADSSDQASGPPRPGLRPRADRPARHPPRHRRSRRARPSWGDRAALRRSSGPLGRSARRDRQVGAALRLEPARAVLGLRELRAERGGGHGRGRARGGDTDVPVGRDRDRGGGILGRPGAGGRGRGYADTPRRSRPRARHGRAGTSARGPALRLGRGRRRSRRMVSHGSARRPVDRRHPGARRDGRRLGDVTTGGARARAGPRARAARRKFDSRRSRAGDRARRRGRKQARPDRAHRPHAPPSSLARARGLSPPAPGAPGPAPRLVASRHARDGARGHRVLAASPPARARGLRARGPPPGNFAAHGQALSRGEPRPGLARRHGVPSRHARSRRAHRSRGAHGRRRLRPHRGPHGIIRALQGARSPHRHLAPSPRRDSGRAPRGGGSG